MKEAKFYCNEPCTILSELDEDSVCIELHNYDDDRLIVDREYISDAKIDIQDEFREARREIEQLKLEAKMNLQHEQRKIDSEIESLKNRAAQFSGLQEMYAYLNGDFEYVVYQSGMPEYDKLDETFCNCDKTDLASIQFRYRKGQPIAMFIGSYGDASDGNRGVVGCRDIETVKDQLIRRLEAEDNQSRFSHWKEEWVRICDELNITHEKIDQFRKELTSAAKKQAESRVVDCEAELKEAKLKLKNCKEMK